MTKLLILLFTVLFFQFSTFAKTQGSYMQYPDMHKFIDRMTNKGFDREFLYQLFSNIPRDEDILAKVNSPAESKPWFNYRPIFVTDKRANAGINFWNRHHKTIENVSKKYSVAPEIIVAIIGVETLYGNNTGKHNVLRSLTTLAMDFPKRKKFYTNELDHFLHFVREERIPNPYALKGSYAGAMGLGQFISSSYRHYGIDFNGDKHRDLWHPDDAIASVANYFTEHGWNEKEDIATPARITGRFYDKIIETKAKKPTYSLSSLARHGVKPVGNIRSKQVSLLELEGQNNKEYWVTGHNFYVITRYNHSPKYAMAVFQLAEKIKRIKNMRNQK